MSAASETALHAFVATGELACRHFGVPFSDALGQLIEHLHGKKIALGRPDLHGAVPRPGVGAGRHLPVQRDDPDNETLLASAQELQRQLGRLIESLKAV